MTISTIQILALATLFLASFPVVLWADIRKISGLLYLACLGGAVALYRLGYYSKIAVLYRGIISESSRGLFDLDIARVFVDHVDIKIGSMSLGLSAIVLTLFFLSRQAFYLKFLSNFRFERDINRVLKILAILSSGLVFFIPIIVISLWSYRKYETHHTVSAGDALIDNEKMSYFVARLCMLRELIRSRKLTDVSQYVFIHPLVRIIEEALRTGVLVLAGVGSGKTNVIYNWFIKPFLGKYRLLIYDQKGDFSDAIGDRDDVAIVSPFLENSFAWHIGKDVNTSSKMVEYLSLLGSFDDNSKNTFFVGAFIDFGTAVFLYLRDEKGEDWDFKDLFDTMQSVDELFRIVKQYRPQAEMFAKQGEEIDQARGVIGTIREKLIKIEALKRAWQNGQERLSLTEFFGNSKSKKRILIIRGDKDFPSLNKAFSTTFLEQCIKKMINGPEGDSKIAVVIDELQTLTFIPSLLELPRVGRSKGIRFVIGTQDFAVTDKQYQSVGGKKGIEGNILNKLVGHMAGGEESESAAKSFKYTNREVWKKDSKTKKWTAQRENNVQALVSGHLSLPKPTLSRPAYFYFKHSDWPILKIGYKIVPVPTGRFEVIPAKWLSDSDIYEGEAISDQRQNDSVDDSDTANSATSGVAKTPQIEGQKHEDVSNLESMKLTSSTPTRSSNLGHKDKEKSNIKETVSNDINKKSKDRTSGIKMKKFRR